ncbi:MAG: substrate-binding domain-containing protein [Enterobacteriaceae bacterium]|jgi:molybdate transport system substrate-binding protein|nr:substrate-binding domain-containing protein [Enterobacteriaceae bacterium]
MSQLLRVFAAGSLRRAFTPLLAAFSRQMNIEIAVDFAPAGILRQRIEQGESVDLFASANSLHPQMLQQQGLAHEIRLFAHNRLCLTVRDLPEWADKSWLDWLRCHDFIVGTSTPECDPGGDYAWQLFDNITSHCSDYPDLGNELKQRAKPLVGGINSLVIPAGEQAAAWLIANRFADMFIGYASYTIYTEQQNNGLRVLTIPEPYNVRADYMLATFSQNGALLADYICSLEGRSYLQQNGFIIPA